MGAHFGCFRSSARERYALGFSLGAAAFLGGFWKGRTWGAELDCCSAGSAGRVACCLGNLIVGLVGEAELTRGGGFEEVEVGQ